LNNNKKRLLPEKHFSSQISHAAPIGFFVGETETFGRKAKGLDTDRCGEGWITSDCYFMKDTKSQRIEILISQDFGVQRNFYWETGPVVSLSFREGQMDGLTAYISF
jgi:hypothetical protein